MNNNDKTLDELRIELVDSWKLKEIVLKDDKNENCKNYYVSEKDYEQLIDKEKLSLSYFYQTHVMPQPFFGNIENPEIVVLAKNPTYNPKYEIKESDEFRKKISKGNNDKENIHNLWFELSSLDFEQRCTQKWWYETFEGFFNKDNHNEFKNILKHVGIFNLCGYHSKTYNNFPSYYFKTDYLKTEKKLPTQICLRNYLEQLVTEPEVKYIILIWGKDEWESLMEKKFFDNLSDKLLIVNKENKTNHKIINAPEIKEKLKNLLKNIAKGNVEVSSS